VTEAPDRPAPGTRLLFRWRKWDGGPHWEHECIYLGSDEWGDWFGQQPGWHSARPGREVVPRHPNVTLVPPSGDFAYTRNAAPARTPIYIDIAWDLRWDGQEPTGIDMDLDVVERDEVGVYVDDRDEWDEHRVVYGYPLEVVERLDALTLDLERRVIAHAQPFDDATAEAWLGRLAALTLGRDLDGHLG
jgi:protein associated with RNAse G/E